MKTRLPEGEWDWGSASFKALGMHKVDLVYTVLRWGLELVITDIDALVLREPFAYMGRWAGAGFLTTSDHLTNTSGSADGGLEDHGALASDFNIGYMYFNVSALPLVRAWWERMRTQRDAWDQGVFNRLARFGSSVGLSATTPTSTALSDHRLFVSYGGVVGGVLPLATFSGGHAHFVSRLSSRRGEGPYSVHTTFQYGGAPGKRHRLREAMLWHDAPAYHAPTAGVLAYAPSIPSWLLHPPRGMSAEGHVALMRHQLRQLRAALVLAHAFGRRLVLPRLVCGYDKYWAPLGSDGVIPGAPPWALPIDDCPLDHLLNPAELRPEASAHVRAFSFLDHPATPAAYTGDGGAVAIGDRLDRAERARIDGMCNRAGARRSVLHVTNLAQVADVLWAQRRAAQWRRPQQSVAGGAAAMRGGSVSGGAVDNGTLLTSAEWRSFRHIFTRLQGGWCCAPRGKKPHAAGFRIMD